MSARAAILILAAAVLAIAAGAAAFLGYLCIKCEDWR